MSNWIKIAKIDLVDRIQQALDLCIAKQMLPQPKSPLPPFVIEQPADSSHGDFACNIALVTAKNFGMSPRQIATALLQELSIVDSYVSTCEIAGPGFLNFFASTLLFSNVLDSIQQEGERYGQITIGAGKRALVEFVSANPTGPMHIGNARGGAIGDCLASLLSWAGYDVSREFYVNDAGNQIDKFALSLDYRYRQLYDLRLQMPDHAYLGEDIIQHARSFAKIYGDTYLNLDASQREQALVNFALPQNILALKQDLQAYRIHYDRWFLESSLHQSGAVEEIICKLKQTGYTYEKEGALWLSAQKLGADQDFVLVRANGIPTYVVPDIAYHYNKLVTRKMDLAINVLGADHHGYIPRLKAALTALSVDVSGLEAVLMQMVRLIKDGEVIKASKRSGKAITLKTLLDEVPIDAARVLFNLREANSQMDFDLDLAIEQSANNPVYYLQYAYARISSIIAKLETQGITPSMDSSIQTVLLSTKEETQLILHLANLPTQVEEAVKSYDPSRITRYAITLASLFHKFYTTCHVQTEQPTLTTARLTLCVCVQRVLQNIFQLLRITAMERM